LMVPVTWVALTKVVTASIPSNTTTLVAVRFPPVTVRTIGPEPATALAGEIDPTHGLGVERGLRTRP